MKQLSIEEKQKVYEYLLNKSCPDLLAALIAERSEETVEWHQEALYDGEPLTLGDILGGAFYWDASPEGNEFWRTLWKEIEGSPEDEDNGAKIEVTAVMDFSALEQLQSQIKDVSLEPLAVPQPDKEGSALKLSDLKFPAGILVSVVLGVAVCLRYAGVI